MNDKTKILLGGGGALLLYLLSRTNKKLTGLGSWSKDRFNTFDYYNTQTQEMITEQSKKDSPYYFGSKDPNAVYDPFYDYTDSPEQLDRINIRESWFNSDESNALRVRVVPSSFAFWSNLLTQYESPHEETYCACILEIFNPYEDSEYDNRLPHITDIVQENLTINGWCYDTDASKLYLNGDGSNGLIKFLKEKNFYYTGEGSSLTAHNNVIRGRHSLFIPELFSFTPYLNYRKPQSTLPWALWRDCDLVYKIKDNYVASDPTYLTEFSFDLKLKIDDNTPVVTHCVIRPSSYPSSKYVWSSGGATNITNQHYLGDQTKVASPIYSRPEVMKALLPYHAPYSAKDFAKYNNGLVESFNILRYVEKYPQFGELDPWKQFNN